jgi:hypothetical protein
MAKKRGLGSSATTHTQQAGKAAAEIEHTAATTVNASRGGRCTAAVIAYASMQQAIGRFEAHNQSGGKAWKPATAIRDAALAFNDHCVRESGSLGRARKRPKRKSK